MPVWAREHECRVGPTTFHEVMEKPAMEPNSREHTNPAESTADETVATEAPKNRNLRRWIWAGGGTAILLIAGAALMQVFRGGEGIAAEVGRADVAAAKRAQASTDKPRNLATVGQAVVTYDEVAREAMSRYGEQVLDQLINRKIIEQACRKRGVTVSKAEVERKITEIAQNFGLAKDGWLRMLQSERHVTPLQYKRDIIWPMLALRKLAGANVKLSDEEIRKAFVRDYGQKVKVRMIMMSNSRRMDEVRDKAVAACQACGGDVGKAAVAFGKLARENSIEPTSQSLDGVVPPIRRYTGPENANLVDAAFSLEKGEISGIVQMPSPGKERYVLLFCEGRTDPVVPQEKIDLVREQIVERLTKQKTQERAATVFAELKRTTPVHNFLSNESTGIARSASSLPFATKVRPASGTLPASPNTATKSGLPR